MIFTKNTKIIKKLPNFAKKCQKMTKNLTGGGNLIDVFFGWNRNRVFSVIFTLFV